MEWISSLEYFDTQEQYQLSHQQYLLIMLFCLKIKKGEQDDVIQDINNQIDNRKFRLSYSSFYNLFHLIGLEYSSKKKSTKAKHHKEYKQLTHSLKIPLFDDQFLLTYFD